MKVQRILNKFIYKGKTIIEAIDMKGYTVFFLKDNNRNKFNKISKAAYDNICKLYLKFILKS